MPHLGRSIYLSCNVCPCSGGASKTQGAKPQRRVLRSIACGSFFWEDLAGLGKVKVGIFFSCHRNDPDTRSCNQWYGLALSVGLKCPGVPDLQCRPLSSSIGSWRPKVSQAALVLWTLPLGLQRIGFHAWLHGFISSVAPWFTRGMFFPWSWSGSSPNTTGADMLPIAVRG